MEQHRKDSASVNPQKGRKPGEASRPADGERRARQAEEIGHEANVNQVRHEPMPASHDDDPDQEAVVRNEEHAHENEGASRRPSHDGQRG